MFADTARWNLCGASGDQQLVELNKVLYSDWLRKPPTFEIEESPSVPFWIRNLIHGHTGHPNPVETVKQTIYSYRSLDGLPATVPVTCSRVYW
jgi:hypothetical protein